jgi:hypothetical protein
MAINFPSSPTNGQTHTDGSITWTYSSSKTAWEVTASGGAGVGSVVAVSNFQTGAMATGTTQMPSDDTIPQITEGDEYMTLAHTALSTSNKLKIEIVVVCSSSAANSRMGVALFRDTTADALGAVSNRVVTADFLLTTSFTHYMTAPSTSSVTYRVRVGSNVAGTTTFNGVTSARIFGDVMASSITITEIKG